MSGVIRFLLLPLAAIPLLLAGCGVPISPEAITATAVADQEAASRNLPPTSGGSTSADLALSLQSTSANVAGTSGQPGQPLDTLPTPTDTPAPIDTPEPTPETEPSATLEAADVADATPEGTAEVTETPSETPTHTPTAEPTATPLPSVASDVNQGFEQEFLGLLNAQRTGRGMGALSFNTTLAAGAEEYAGYMGTNGFFGHNGPDGSTPASRAQATGYPGSWNGEALSAGQPTPQTALNALLASAPHAAILLDARSIEVGIGYVYVPGSRYFHYWVIVTGIP
jgi:uncharacterized protein YkwD